MNKKQEIIDKALEAWENEFPFSVEIAAPIPSFAVFRSDKEEARMQIFIEEQMTLAYEAGRQEHRGRTIDIWSTYWRTLRQAKNEMEKSLIDYYARFPINERSEEDNGSQ